MCFFVCGILFFESTSACRPAGDEIPCERRPSLAGAVSAVLLIIEKMIMVLLYNLEACQHARPSLASRVDAACPKIWVQ